MLREGDCLSGQFDTVACSDPAAEYTVTTVVDGSTDVDACPDGTRGRAYRSAEKVVCVAART